MFFKISVLKNFTIFAGKHLCWSYFLIKLQAWRSAILLKRLQHRCFLVNIVTFLEHLFWRTSANGCLCTSNHKVSNKYWASFLNQKHDGGWWRFVDLVRLYSLLLVETIPTRFYCLTCRKIEVKLKNRSSDVMILIGLDRLPSKGFSNHFVISLFLCSKLSL